MKVFSYNLAWISVAFVFFFLFPTLAVGQTDTISITRSPLFPEPQEAVTISVISRIININDKQTVWQKDGEVVDSGVGIDEVTVNVGNRGEPTIVSFQVIVDGQIVERNMEITPVDVDLVWESEESYTPAFYKGKALHPGWGPVRVTALPNIYRNDGTKYDLDELVYTWEYNGLVYGGDSGRGENSFTVNTVPRRGNTVTVEIETPGGEPVASESVTIPIDQPEVVLYEHSPLFGSRLETALVDNHQLEAEEIEIMAYPYFFLVDEAAETSMSYEWEMNGETLESLEQNNVVRLRQRGDSGGEARIAVEVDDVSRIFPDQTANLTLKF